MFPLSPPLVTQDMTGEETYLEIRAVIGILSLSYLGVHFSQIPANYCSQLKKSLRP